MHWPKRSAQTDARTWSIPSVKDKTMSMKESLQQKIDMIGSPVEMHRNSQAGPYVFPVLPEFSNWRDE
jgi:hypothetical protein